MTLKELLKYEIQDAEVLSKITELELEDDELDQLLDRGILPGLTGLKSLRLSGINNLKNLPLLPALEKLVIRNCHLDYPLDFMFLSSLPGLRELYLDGVKGVKNLKDLPLLPALEALDISNCDFDHPLDFAFFSSLPGLEWLYLGSVKVVNNRMDLSLLPALEELEIYFCLLDHPLDCAIFPSLPGLKSLTIQGMDKNDLMALPPLPVLEELDIESCVDVCENAMQITDIEALYDRLPSLRDFSINDYDGVLEAYFLWKHRNENPFGDKPIKIKRCETPTEKVKLFYSDDTRYYVGDASVRNENAVYFSYVDTKIGHSYPYAQPCFFYTDDDIYLGLEVLEFYGDIRFDYDEIDETGRYVLFKMDLDTDALEVDAGAEIKRACIEALKNKEAFSL